MLQQLKYFFCYLVLLFLSCSFSSAQELDNKDFQVGYDLRQGFYFGFNHHFKNYSMGADVGTSLGITEPWQYVSITMDNNYAFGNENPFAKRPWIANLRLIWGNNFETDSNQPNGFFLTPGIGYNHYFNKHSGLHFGVGMNILLTTHDKTSASIPNGKTYAFDQDVSLSVRLEYFF